VEGGERGCKKDLSLFLDHHLLPGERQDPKILTKKSLYARAWNAGRNAPRDDGGGEGGYSEWSIARKGRGDERG